YELVVADNIEPVVLGPVAVPVLKGEGAIAAAIEALGGVYRGVDEVVGEHLRADPPAVLCIERDVVVVWSCREWQSAFAGPRRHLVVTFQVHATHRSALSLRVVDELPNVKPPTTTGHVRTYASRLNLRRS